MQTSTLVSYLTSPSKSHFYWNFIFYLIIGINKAVAVIPFHLLYFQKFKMHQNQQTSGVND